MSFLRSLPARSGVVGVAVAAATWIALTTAGALPTTAAPARADTGSAVTVTAIQQDPDVEHAPMQHLEVTVSQTRDLVAQGITVSWTNKGGVQSTPPNVDTGGSNFLQIAQCWGTDPLDPTQPDRTTCQFGSGSKAVSRYTESRPSMSAVATQDLMFTQPGANPYTSIPFRSVDGTVVSDVVNQKKIAGINVNENQFFTAKTTNEIGWAGSGADGSGSAKFEVQTSLQSRGLGCGNPLTADSGQVTGQPCWLVIIPRGTADNGETTIKTSGLLWDSWKHHLAVKLDFQPLGLRCVIGAAERQLAGSELAAGAVASWQPSLCGAAGGSIYSLLTKSETDALTAGNSMNGAPLALTSRPLTVASGESDTLAYAPVALTALTVAFAIDRSPKPFGAVPADVLARAGIPMTSMKLTPRLLAKLLTNSYTDSLPTSADISHVKGNPRTIVQDPDFLAVNDPEWAYQSIVGPSVADLLVPQGRSDAADAVWRYILADADARDFLAGKADQWGMIVNPWNTTNAIYNQSGAALVLPRDDFPKADPVEKPTSNGGGPINLITWRPYTNDFDTAGYLTLRGDGQILGNWQPTDTPPKYGKADRSLPGQQKVLGLTDWAAASKYQLQTAELLNPAGQFVAPTTQSVTAAAAAMTASAARPDVLGYDASSAQAKAAATAYPLALPVYAAASVAETDATLRADYAAFIRYAVDSGQQPGAAQGQLPAGYAPLPASWTTRSLAAAALIKLGPDTPVATETPAPAESTPPSDSAPAASNTAAGDGSGSVSQAPTPTTVTPTGAAAAPLASGVTPADPATGQTSAAVPLSALAGLGAAIAVPLVSRRRPLRTWNRR